MERNNRISLAKMNYSNNGNPTKLAEMIERLINDPEILKKAEEIYRECGVLRMNECYLIECA